MPHLEPRQVTVFHAPTARRNFQTKRAAAHAEAAAMIKAKYPTEHPQYEDGHRIDGGWHWIEDERLMRLHKRLKRRLMK